MFGECHSIIFFILKCLFHLYLLFLYFKMFYVHKGKFIGKRSKKYSIMLGRRIIGSRPPYLVYLH